MLAKQIMDLCERIVACQDETECSELARQLGVALRAHIESIRGRIVVLPPELTMTDVQRPS